MRSIVGVAEVFLDRLARAHAPAFSFDDLRAVGGNLTQFVRRRLLRHIDRAVDTCRRCVRGDGGAGVACRIERDLLDADVVDLIDQRVSAAILEGAGRQKVLRLQQILDAVNLDAQKFGVHVSDCDFMHSFFVGRLVQMEHAAAFAAIVHRADGIFFFALFAVKIHGASRLSS